MLFGDRREWAWEVRPLAEPPPGPDPEEAASWAEIALWVRGRNLARHIDPGTDRVEESVRWPAIHLARWIVRSWPGLWERQGSPWPTTTHEVDPIAILAVGDRRAASPEVDDEWLETRNRFVASHALAAASGGAALPDVAVLREGSVAHVGWSEKPAGDVRFLCGRGLETLPAPAFVQACLEFVGWAADRAGPGGFAAEARRWRERVESGETEDRALLGRAWPWGARGEPPEDLGDWLRRAGRGERGAIRAAAMFSGSLAPVLDWADIRALWGRLAAGGTAARESEALERARRAVGAPPPSLPAHEQGYLLADRFREHLGRPAGHLDVERLVRDELDLEVTEVDLLDDDLRGLTAWAPGARRPRLFLNRRARWRSTSARRMTLAHELCHVLVDASAVRPLALADGPWAPPTLERRANAFAAELLLPRAALVEAAGPALRRGWLRADEVDTLSQRFEVSATVVRWQVRNRLDLVVEEP